MPSYYDIDAILTDSQKVPCTFEITVPGLGYLDGNPGEPIKEGTKVELPLWLGEMLAVTQNNTNTPTLSLDLPQCLSARVVNALKADPRVVDIRALAPHFYALGSRMLELFDEEELLDVLTDTFKRRAKEIADQAHHPRGVLGEGAEFLRGLDESERQLFRSAHESSKAVRNWMVDLKK
ncbi:DNA replication complex GINS protein PSF3 [Trichodelitschia bisporula]|uniref:DNA replication complex GINS protein PSF3 n=1 Tax=Trichodelitschia bisporula TaxID=703511 RepID=A0A6G1HYH4_9PEZI|nr:DNA replication complex GINS protein PSF3 [Trichodelitschia bisporula]